jgi:DUF1680 family protein
MNVTRALSPRSVRITGGFWKEKQDLVADHVLPYQWKALNDEVPGAEPSHSIENFRIAAGEKQGQFYGLIFQDSDIGKWIEAAAYSLMGRPDPALEARIDDVVALIGRAQEPDGYLQTYFSVKQPGKRWTDFAMGHEMYCGGHLMEGAVAYYQATGKTAFLDIMKRYADHLHATFGPGPGQLKAYDGHPEIELALYKLYEATGIERYRDVARFFVDERGKDPGVLDHAKILGWPVDPKAVAQPDYSYYQAHQPVRDQREAVGHSVRAMYLYTAMADQRRLDSDASLDPALDSLWANTVNHKMYVTGGLGSQAAGERFTIDDDFPSDTAYTETCAAIGLVLWAWRMTLLDPDSRYADILERALYNGSLAGISANGKRYFYVNPLEVVPKVARFRKDHDHVKTQRVEWFGCACCPPNIARTIASFSQYQYSVGDRGVWVHQFAEGRAEVPFRGGLAVIDQATAYPWDGRVTLTVRSIPGGVEPWNLFVRLPDWCPGATVSVNGKAVSPHREKGYAVLSSAWKAGDVVVLDLPMEVRFLRSHPRVRETFGKVAVQRGPLVYCAEEADNGADLHTLSLLPTAAKTEVAGDLGPGAVRLRVLARRTPVGNNEGPFGTEAPKPAGIEAVLVPYHLWGNRGEGEMAVWLAASLSQTAP